MAQLYEAAVIARDLNPSNFAASFVGALLTAAPSFVASLATLPSSAATSVVESALYGQPSGFPTWYSALPTDIQSYLSVNDPRRLETTLSTTHTTTGTTTNVPATTGTTTNVPATTGTTTNVPTTTRSTTDLPTTTSGPPVSSTSQGLVESAVSSSQITPSTTTTSTFQSSPSSQSSPSEIVESNSSPVGAIIGGTVGGVALVLILGIFLFIGHRRGWFKKQGKVVDSEVERGAQYDNKEKDQAGLEVAPPYVTSSELDGVPRSELDGTVGPKAS